MGYKKTGAKVYGRKLIISLFPLFMLSGCSTYVPAPEVETIGRNYIGMLPAKAITAIANEYSKGHFDYADTRSGVSIFLPAKAADLTFAAAQDYCRGIKGHDFDWSHKTGIVCAKSNGSGEIFVIKRHSGGDERTVLSVLEFTETNRKDLEYQLKTLWNYTTVAEFRRQGLDELEKLETKKLSDEIKRQRLIEKRISERGSVVYLGAQVCHTVESRNVLGTSINELVAVVERIEGNRIKIFVESIVVPNAPGLRPSGFQQHYAWVNVWDVYACK